MYEAKITSHELKRMNRSKIYQYIYHARSSSRPEIAHALQISFPTVAQNLSELEEYGLIEKSGFQKSTGGRKAQMVVCNPTARIAIGLEILKEFVKVSAIDLYGTVLKKLQIDLNFSKEPSYFHGVCQEVNEFIRSLPYPSNKILGIGIALQGLVSADGKTLTYGKLFNFTGLQLENFSQYFDYPCIFIHDSEAAASAELWFQNGITDAVYLSLNRNLGGAVIINGAIRHGYSRISGTLEHMCLIPDGKPCYCGKKGCLEAYCSADSLKNVAGESLDEFFLKLRQGEPRRKEIWDTYLYYLAIGIANIRYVLDYDFVIGGLVQTYFTDEDYLKLSEMIQKRCGLTDQAPPLIPGKNGRKITSIGAALYYVKKFLETI